MLRPGDSVHHKKFGDGLVLSAAPLGNDVLLEVAFDTCGTKKLMQNAARLEKLKVESALQSYLDNLTVDEKLRSFSRSA